MVNNLPRTIAIVSALLLAAVCTAARAAEISLRTDRSTIRMNEAFTLTFSAHGQVDAEPDFSPLQQDFEIAGTSQSSSFTLGNGQAESRIDWMVTVFPKRAGTLTVPPIRFGGDASPELRLEVQAGADPGATADKEVFITVETDPGDPYVQAQTLVTVRLYRTQNMANESLSPLPPEFSSGDVIVHPLDEGTNFVTQLYGRQYKVHERQYAVFPQQSGLLRIKPLQYNGVRVDRRGMFDAFPFGFRGAPGQPVQIQSEAVTLEVRPPAATPWLPAARLKLEEIWSGEPAEFKVGEPLTRRLSITATGLTAEQLPELSTAAVDGFKQYPDQPSLENRKSETGITGVREESVAFIPTRPGSYTLPAVELKWWNTRTGKQEIARVPERSVTVAPSPDGAYAPAPAAPGGQTQAGSQAVPGQPGPGQIPAASRPVWFWLSLVLALGWLLTLAAWWRHNRNNRSRGHKPSTSASAGRDRADAGRAESLLEQACRGNRPDAARDALIGWARARWQEHPPQNLEAIAARSRHEALTAQLRALNARLYAPSSVEWEGKALWQAFVEYKKSVEADPERQTPSLPPLHKI